MRYGRLLPLLDLDNEPLGSGTLLRYFVVEKISCVKFSQLLNGENFPIYGTWTWANSTTRKNLVETTLLANQGVDWLWAYKFCGYSVRQWVCHFLFTDEQGNPHHLCMLTYYIPAKFEPYVRPHGNSKSPKPFHPTWPSTSEMIKKEGAHTDQKRLPLLFLTM